MKLILRLFCSMLIVLPVLLNLSACGKEDGPVDNKKDNTSAAADKASGKPASWGESLAKEKCHTCHDENNRTRILKGMPFISGLDPLYLRNSLDAYYMAGTRESDKKAEVLQTLSNEEKQAITQYYASLPGNWYGKDTIATKTLAKFRNPELLKKGEAVSFPCQSCHGKDGHSIKDGVPSLSGLQPEYFITSLKSYLSGERQGAEIMKNFKHALNTQNIQQLAAYFTHKSRSRSKLPTGGGNAKSGKRKARSCFGCHGPDGNSFNPAFPGIAGQNAAYLKKSLRHYRSGSRKNKLMQDAVAKLSNRDIDNISVYFARQKPRSRMASIRSSEQSFSPITQGEQLAMACNGCHGPEGKSDLPGVPSLQGMHFDYLTQSIRAYQDGSRQHDVMQLQVTHLGTTEIEQLGFYYASRDTVTEKAPDKGDAAPASSDKTGSCDSCHGTNGVSTSPATPSIAGQDKEYLIAVLKAYQAGSRSNDDMLNALKDLDENGIKEVAVYFSSQQAAKPETRTPEGPEQLSRKCNRCHGNDGMNSDPKIPRIGGQTFPYLLKVLEKYKSNERDQSTMHKMTAMLTQLEIDAISKYYARK